MGVEGDEEAYVLRVEDAELAARIRRLLREEEHLQGNIELDFPEDGRNGILKVENKQYTLRVLDLPTVVESYKTYDDINLVKTGDVGQVLVVGAQIPKDIIESPDGVTPPMRKARERHFRPQSRASPAMVSAVEDAIHQILNGCAPQGCEFVDVEEVWEIDAATGKGAWKPAPKVISAGQNAEGETGAGDGKFGAGTGRASGRGTARTGGRAAQGETLTLTQPEAAP